MRQILTLILLSLFFVSCADKAQNSSIKKNTLSNLQIEILDIDNLKNQGGQINSKLEKFDLGKRVNGKTKHRYSSDKILSKEFINVFGYDENGNVIAYRQEITAKSKGNHYVLTFVENGLGETCTSINCGNCIIKDGGGCNSSEPIDSEKPYYCNNTVTTESAFLAKDN